MNELKNIVIIGAGGLGREVAAILGACNSVRMEWNVLGFLDSSQSLVGSEVGGLPVLGGDDWRRNNAQKSVRFICAIGDPQVRRQVVEKFTATGSNFASIVHPDVRVPDSVRVGVGTVVMAGTRFTTDANIGSHVVIYLNCSITHDVQVNDFCLISSGCNLSGGVVLETGVQLGTGVSVLPQRRIGAWAIIGAGSVVIHDIPANSTAVGIPSRVIRT